jgi:hypothetical protein
VQRFIFSNLAMRRKIKGYIFQFTSADHDGRHVHVYRDNCEIGVYDKVAGPIRGLEKKWNGELREAMNEFIKELNECGYFQ